MYYSAIGLLAVLILLIENYDVLLTRRDAFGQPVWSAYRGFLLAILAYYVTDILWGFLESRKLAGLLFADTTVYFIAMAAGLLFWARYAVAYLDEESAVGRLLVNAGRLLPGAIALLAVVNIFTPVLFTVDADCVYRALPVRYAVLGVQILLLLLISAYAVSLRQRRGAPHGKRYLALALYGLIMALFLFVQLWYPYLPLYTIAYLLGTGLLHTFVINVEREEFQRGLQEASSIAERKETITSLLNNMPGMTFAKDAQTGVYLACNQAFAAYAKKADPDGVVGLTDAELFDPVIAEHMAEDDQMALALDEPYVFFVDATISDGRRREYQTTKRKYTDAAGRLCVLGTCIDVTDNVRIRRESATTKEAYEKARGAGIIFTHIAQALARSYKELYYVNTENEEYIEYRTADDGGTLSETRRGWHFFEQCRVEAETFVYPEDRDAVIRALDRKTLAAALDRNNTFFMTYRLGERSPSYVSMKVTRMRDDDRYIILGIMDIDEEMQQRRAAERMQEEQTAYARVNALTGDYLCIYVVDPVSGHYREFSASSAFERFALAEEGEDFFADSVTQGRSVVFREDLNRFLTSFNKENILDEIGRNGIFTLSYRLLLEGKPTYVQLKAAMVQEKEGARLIVGINDIDAQVRQEEAYAQRLAQARIEASVDALTGVKNRHAFLMAEERLNRQIDQQPGLEFAVVVLDVNDLKKVNDTDGHEAGDQLLRNACEVICETFKRSPVFRIGGDEFTVIVQGNDYACIEELLGRLDAHNRQARRSGGIVIACGMARHETEASMAPVFERADQAMYENKSRLKAEKDEAAGM